MGSSIHRAAAPWPSGSDPAVVAPGGSFPLHPDTMVNTGNRGPNTVLGEIDPPLPDTVY